MIVLLADLKTELSRQTTYQQATDLKWCGNTCLVLHQADKIALVGPFSTEYYEIAARALRTCVDGLMIVSKRGSHFLTIVQESTVDTFGLAQ